MKVEIQALKRRKNKKPIKLTFTSARSDKPAKITTTQSLLRLLNAHFKQACQAFRCLAKRLKLHTCFGTHTKSGKLSRTCAWQPLLWQQKRFKKAVKYSLIMIIYLPRPFSIVFIWF